MTVKRNAAVGGTLVSIAVRYAEPPPDVIFSSKAHGADVSRGYRMRDGASRHGVASAPRRRFRDVGLRRDPLAFDGALHGRAADTEELDDFEGAVLAAGHQ
jgi:hypothetical protein